MAFLLHRPPARILIPLLALLALGVILAPHGNAHPLVHTVALDQRPVDLVVDARLGHAFIATAPVTGGSSEVRTIDTTTGVLTQVIGSPFPTGGAYAFSIVADPSGKFVYVANLFGGIEAFTIELDVGQVTDQVVLRRAAAGRENIDEVVLECG